jgi:hypothetical protein
MRLRISDATFEHSNFCMIGAVRGKCDMETRMSREQVVKRVF